MSACTTEGAFDEIIIVKFYTSMEALTVSFVDAVEIGGGNFVSTLFERSEFVIHFVSMVGC